MNKTIEKPHCLNCNTPDGPYIYCKHLAFRSEGFDVTGETQACIHWTQAGRANEGIKICKGLRLTRTEDGVFLHFEISKDRASGVRLDQSDELWKGVAYEWAVGLLDG